MLDTGAPHALNIDVRALAQEFGAMTGANIRNAALTAAFTVGIDGTRAVIIDERAHDPKSYRRYTQLRSVEHSDASKRGRSWPRRR